MLNIKFAVTWDAMETQADLGMGLPVDHGYMRNVFGFDKCNVIAHHIGENLTDKNTHGDFDRIAKKCIILCITLTDPTYGRHRVYVYAKPINPCAPCCR